MKLKLLSGLLVAGAIPFVFSACKDDPVPKSGISFEKTAEETTESDGTLLSFHPDLSGGGKGHDLIVKIKLDRPLAETVVLSYTATGTATSVNPAENYLVNDYALKEGTSTIISSDKITIEKGATEATLKLTVFEDIILADTDNDDVEVETVVLTLVSVVSGPATLGENKTYTLTINEDDSVVVLYWEDGTSGDVGDVDMDMFAWYDGDIYDYSASLNADATVEAVLFYGGYPQGEWGLSYTYYEGTSDDVNFGSMMLGYFNGEFFKYYPGESDNVLIYQGHYTLANLNHYSTDTGVIVPLPLVVQSLDKTGTKMEATEITEAESGSRSSLPVLGSHVISKKELSRIKSLQIKKFLKDKVAETSLLEHGGVISK